MREKIETHLYLIHILVTALWVYNSQSLIVSLVIIALMTPVTIVTYKGFNKLHCLHKEAKP